MRWLLLIFLFNWFSASAQHSLNLHKGWQFRKAGTGRWYNAEVPGTVHTDLLTNKLIQDPFYGTNESNVQWVESETWEYRLAFDVSSALFKQKHIELQFDGLDTHAEVLLNGKKVIIASNMFRQWTADVRSLLLPARNQLRVRFFPGAVLGKLAKQGDSIRRPENERVYVRKAQYQFGWDWGPRLVTAGIWKGVRLVAWDKMHIEDVQAYMQGDSAELRMEVFSDTAGTFFITTRQMNYNAKFHPPQHVFGGPVRIVKGKNFIRTTGVSGDLIWTWDSIQVLNSIDIEVVDTTDYFAPPIATYNLRFGTRDIQLVTPRDSIGEAFYFTVDGQPTFIKGANWIPVDNFLPRVKKLKRYERLIKAAKEANINMLRVWGGGVYEDDAFYDLCDKYGIMVWQDFMFAGALYPADSAFMKNVESEVRYQVKRLRNHPCIVLWCGNNEIEEAWFNWGWQKQFNYSAEDSSKLWHDYKTIFHELIPFIINELDPQRPYWPSSPSLGWGRDSAYRKGDVHYWGVWWGKEPVEKYNEKAGRFVSEYGMQGMPGIKTIRQFSESKDWDTSSPVMRAHQKHPFGWENIKHYIEARFKTPKTFEDLVYVSQLMQADAIKTAIEAHRRNKPVTMGTLFWQWNDCWPVTSWSAVDYYGRKKALYYEVKRSFAPLTLSVVTDSVTYGLQVSVMSDLADTCVFDIAFQMFDFGGTHIRSGIVTPRDTLLPNGVKKYSLKPNYYLDAPDFYLLFQVKRGDTVLAEYTQHYLPPKKLRLSRPVITWKIRNKYMELQADKFAYGVDIDAPDGVELEDNYFHLHPGQKKSVKFSSTVPVGDLKKMIKIRSLVDTY
ncbi:MAG: beta-mannosidase [Chitinophagaceae bacterium]|jgi:beta-mannosidase|nr:beta-mannosidase [Chitinophagaceae bacterium]